ncbi:MAG TPA: carboxypeptidase regulatory-like domain-containing protein [Longimicrobium sp.]|nr:carboxypeptidase regulatory-like domain-containing protein [Longimicrobium sp.]
MHLVRRLIALFALLLLPRALAAQVGGTTDIITGRVTGPDGKGVAGVSIEVTSAETSVRRTTATRPDGRFTLTFPEGGGRYRVRAVALGFAPQTANLVRQADEDVLSVDFRLSEQAVALRGIEARASRTPPPGRGDVGGQERNVSSELVNRLPLEDNDPARVAQLSPGVVGTAAADSSEQRQSFSVAGQRQSLNQITVDGTTFASVLSGGQFGGGSPLGLPQEGLRGTQVVTNSYDVARGQFTGGQVSMTTRAGSNFLSGSFSWNLRDPTLQGGAGRPAWGGGFTQNRLSGGIGGPIRKDKAFWFVSASAQQRTDRLFSLTPNDGTALTALGVAPDSVQRFLSILRDHYGVTGETGRFSRTGDALSLLGRVDVNLNERHTLAVRGHLNLYSQDRARIGFLETLENGGEVQSDGKGAILSLNSRFGGSWINDARASITDDHRDQVPYATVPEGRVRVTSVLEDGRLGVATLAFGGDRTLPSTSRETTVEVTDELSFLFRDKHRIKLGGLVNHTGFDQEQTFNRLGSFDFNSLADFQAGTASRFTRSLAPRTTSGGGVNAAVYLGDTYRPTQQLQVTFGVRAEGTRFDRDPAANPAIQALFGRRTDQLPAEVHVSPRVGFSLRLNQQGEPLRLLRGGVGEFRGRAPLSLYASALDQTGLETGQGQIVCVGPGVPAPDWGAYQGSEEAIPTACATTGPAPAIERRPTVTLFSPRFAAPRSWRASMGFQTQLLRFLGASIDVSQAWGVDLFGVRDLNLDTSLRTFLPAEDNRPVFVPAEAIVPATGEAAFFASRRFAQYGQVFEVNSRLGSTTTLVTLGLNGLVSPRVLFSASYTWMRSRDQSSFAGGSPVQGYSQVPVAGDPNQLEWARSDLERRHQLLATVGLPLSQTFELTLIGRASSGAPFTPMVGGDINGDGARNDRAYVFDPSNVYDDAISVGMRRLLAGADSRTRGCLIGQFGQIAARNSCTGSWSTSLDARATIRPPQVKDRRLSVSIDATNLPAGVDLLLHGQSGLHGWGQADFGRDNVLLYPKGWDAAERRFDYQVNETFGQNRIRRATFSPFQVALTARMNVGRQAQQGIGGLASIAFGGFGGGGGGRDGGGQGGGGIFRQGGGVDVDLLLDRVIPEPVSAILLLKDTLRLTDAQQARLREIADSLRTRNAPLREQIRAAVPQNAGSQGDFGAVFQRIGPQIQAAGANVNRAMQQVQEALTPEQWRRIPAALRNPFGAFGPGGGPFRGGGGGGGNRPVGQRPRDGAQSPAPPAPQPATTPPAPETSQRPAAPPAPMAPQQTPPAPAAPPAQP